MVIVIKRNRIVACVAALIAVAAAAVGFYEINSQNTSSLPISSRVVILDAGHGGADGGAVGSDGTAEKDLNLQVALKTQALLEQSGCTVFMTRSEDISLSTPEDDEKRQRKTADLNNRKKMVEEYGVEAFVSIHMNTFPDPQYGGTQVFYAKTPQNSKKLAECIQQEVAAFDPENTRVAKDGTNGIYVLQETNVPSVVVECGFLSNSKDLERLKTEEYQNELANAVFCGITKFFSN